MWCLQVTGIIPLLLFRSLAKHIFRARIVVFNNNKKNYKQVFRTLYYVRNCSNIKARESVNSLCKHEIPILRRLLQVVNAAGRKQMDIIQKKPGFHDTNIWDTGYIKKKNTVRTSQKTNGNGLHISKSHKLTWLLRVVKFLQ